MHVIFETISAFGNVGLSLGFRSLPTSFVGVLSPVSKLVIVSVMLAGRHRGLSEALGNMERYVCPPAGTLFFGVVWGYLFVPPTPGHCHMSPTCECALFLWS